MPEKNLYEALPIPTYDEAVGASSPSRTDELGEASERQGLLGDEARLPVPTRRAGYRPTPTEDGNSARGSLDQHDSFLNQNNERRSTDTEEGAVRQEMEELEMEDTPVQSPWRKRISSLSSSMNLPKLKFAWPKMDANFCIIIGRCFAVALVVAVVYLLFMSDLFPTQGRQMFDPESVRQHVQMKAAASSERIRNHLMKITQNDHVAGTEGDYVLAKYVHDFFQESGLEDVHMDRFDVYLNYPKEGGRKVDLLRPNGEVEWSAKIDEDPVYKDPPRAQTPVFHGHSKSGDVKGPLIYANYGSRKDFKALYDSAIETKGAIALVRYGGSQGDRALKVKAAELAGFAGCIIYSDPADDGFRKGEVAPAGRYMPEGGVQRGAVSLMSWVIGDVLTPGFASVKDAPRISKENNAGLVNIPSIPLSWGDAKHLLAAIQNHGQEIPDWTGGIPDIKYWTGNLTGPQVHLVNNQDEVDEQPIWNVMGKILGIEQKEKSIIIGSHRDAWGYGAVDPGSGTASMLEVVSIFGDLVQKGWRPLRTIEFASWDAEEYNLIGSTEFVERDIERLRRDAFVYLNVDSAVVGNEFAASGSPVFTKSLLRVLNRVSDPQRNSTLRALWDHREGHLEGLGAGSDYVAFQDIAGTSSLDFGFGGPGFAYHSAYDNFEYMDTVIDPGFKYHGLIVEVWCLLILEFSDRYVLPFDMAAYSASLIHWVMDLEHWAENKGGNVKGNVPWSTEPLREAVLQFAKDAKLFEKWEMEWDSVVLAGGNMESASLAAHRKSHNNRMANFETNLLDLEEGGGVPNRTQFKHVIFGPQLWSGYDEAFFPAVRDAVDERNWALAKTQVEKAAMIIKRASKKLIGNT